MREAVYAGDDYAVASNGLKPYDDELEFLTWDHVEAAHALVVPRERTAATFRHPPGTALHEDMPLQKMVEEHFKAYGSSVGDAAGHYEDVVRTADPWNVTYGQGWYQSEAGHAVQRLHKLGYTRHQAAHLIADLSPQNPWFGTKNHPEMGNREEAVRYGRECQDMMGKNGKYESGKLTITDDDVARASDRFKDARIQAGRYDISHPNPSKWEVSPKDLAELPAFHSRATRKIRANAIGTALKIRHPDQLGPKTYPFHDNIMDPFSSPYATIDTWMVDASGIHLPRSERPKFLSSKSGARGHDIPVYRGLGQVGLASAITAATHSLNKKPPDSMLGHRPLQPMHTQAIIWTEHQWRNNPKFQKASGPLRDLPWGEVFGYNFGYPHA